MREYDIYLPTKENDGSDVNASEIQKVKETLTEVFGGYSEMTQRCNGAWKLDGATFRDEVKIIRILDDGSAKFDMSAFRVELEERFKQRRVLIVERRVKTV